MNALARFLERGPERRRALNNALAEGMNYYLGPTGIPQRLNALGILNPVNDMEQAGRNAQDMLAPGKTGQERFNSGVGMVTDMATVLAPVVAGKFAGSADDAANFVESLTGIGAMERQGAMDAGRRFVDDEAGAIKYRNEMRGFHNNQSDQTLRIYEDDAPVGYIDYSVYDDQPALQMVEISPEFRRQGYATSGLQELQRKFPDQEIDWGSLTSDGSELYRKTDFYDVDQTGGINQILPEIEAKAKAAEADYLDTFKDGYTGNVEAVREEFYRLDDELQTALAMAETPPKKFINTAPANALSQTPAQGIRAYHGSPHDFDEFRMDKIGTGEGAQAYGHGLYFAENEGVARSYRDALSQAPMVDGKTTWARDMSDPATAMVEVAANNGGKTVDDAIALAQSKIDELGNLLPKDTLQGYYDLIDELSAFKGKPISNGSMYEVNINANPDDFLDWDAPLSAQPAVLDRLKGYGNKYRDEISRLTAERDAIAAIAPAPQTGGDEFADLFSGSDWGGWQKISQLNKKIEETESAARQAKGALFSETLNDNFLSSTMGSGLARGRNTADASDLLGIVDDRQLSSTLQEAGIPGIKYRDAGSRGVDGVEGTRNYVVFDENLINIVRKYGIAGAAAMLGVSASDVEASMAGQNALGGDY